MKKVLTPSIWVVISPIMMGLLVMYLFAIMPLTYLSLWFLRLYGLDSTPPMGWGGITGLLILWCIIAFFVGIYLQWIML